MIVETKRLILRQWREGDRSLFADLNADPETMRFFPRTLSDDESNAFIDKSIASINTIGYGWMAVEIKETHEFIGSIGLSNPRFEAHFTPCTEIGWRLHRKYWGKGYATEGASVVLDYGFNGLGHDEIVSFTSIFNIPSIRVMKRIGMTSNHIDDFDHPRVEEGHRLKKHVLYRSLAKKR
jgi:RimJ/RimL family protein N-acetyltransferase